MLKGSSEIGSFYQIILTIYAETCISFLLNGLSSIKKLLVIKLSSFGICSIVTGCPADKKETGL